MQRNYRGQRVDTKEWVYGYLTKSRTSPRNSEPPYTLQWVIDHEENGVMLTSFVIPETVGQSTGLPDKNGKEIYKGDIIIYCNEKALVIWNECGYELQWLSKQCYYREELFFWATERKISIIGNIYDNPELLQEVDNGFNR